MFNLLSSMTRRTSESFAPSSIELLSPPERPSILVDSFSLTASYAHGGYHRTQQIAELVEQANFRVVPFQRRILATKRERISAGLAALFNPTTFQFVLKHQLKIRPSASSIAFCGFQRQLYRSVLQQHSEPKLLIWEATKNYVAPYVAAELGFRSIALPQNLESLACGQDIYPEGFETEIESFAKASAVFCIAREEAWLLNLKGINAQFLPYYPPRDRFEQLLQVRQQRQHAVQSYFLILGSASHPPTREGMIEQIEWLKRIQPTQPFVVHIAGRNTETLASFCDHPDFVLHGSVSEDQLTQLLIHAKAILIHQKAGGGAITRIPDMLIAGMPVIANGHACRSAFDYAGVYCYDDTIELQSRISQTLEKPEIPPRPTAAEKRFINCLVELAGAESQSS